jgi:hypothetical protein
MLLLLLVCCADLLLLLPPPPPRYPPREVGGGPVVPPPGERCGDRGVLIVAYASHKKKAYSFFLLQVRLAGVCCSMWGRKGGGLGRCRKGCALLQFARLAAVLLLSCILHVSTASMKFLDVANN